MIRFIKRLFTSRRLRIQSIPVRVNSIGRAKFVRYRKRGDPEWMGNHRAGVQLNLYLLCPTCKKDQETAIIGGTMREMRTRVIRCRRCGEYLRPRWTRPSVRQLRVWRDWARRYVRRERELTKISCTAGRRAA